MKEYTLPRGTRVVHGDEVPETCERLVLPSSVREIDAFAFFGNNALKELVFPEGLEKIGDCAFRECASLKEVVFPGSLRELESSAFMDCTSLRRVIFTGVGPEVISTEAFCGCRALSEVRLGSGLRILSDGMELGGAFQDCVSLKAVALPEGCEIIGCATFRGCTRLSRIGIPSTLLGVGEMSLEGTPITELVLPEGAVTLWKAIYGCNKLKRIVLPSTMQSLSYKIFGGLPQLREVVLPERFREDLGLYFDEASLGRLRIKFI